MISIMKENDRNKYGVTEYIADSYSDVKNLPTTCASGSICLVIDSADVYILNNKKEWKML